MAHHLSYRDRINGGEYNLHNPNADIDTTQGCFPTEVCHFRKLYCHNEYGEPGTNNILEHLVLLKI